MYLSISRDSRLFFVVISRFVFCISYFVNKKVSYFVFILYLCTQSMKTMKKQLSTFLAVLAMMFCMNSPVMAQNDEAAKAAVEAKAEGRVLNDADSITDAMADSLDTALEDLSEQQDSALVAPVENGGLHKSLKTKFIEGNAGFMSLVALALIIGLAFCIERLIYLSLAQIKTRKFLGEIDAKIQNGDIEGAKELSRNTRGPVASICYQGLLRADDDMDEIERSVEAYGSVQVAKLDKGCSWITLFIAIAPSLGFLGTVIGMVMAFDQIQSAGDISPTIVAAGMKVALITTIFGIIAAVILQVFYNYILTKIERLTSEMEDAAVTLFDALGKYKMKKG